MAKASHGRCKGRAASFWRSFGSIGGLRPTLFAGTGECCGLLARSLSDTDRALFQRAAKVALILLLLFLTLTRCRRDGARRLVFPLPAQKQALQRQIDAAILAVERHEIPP